MTAPHRNRWVRIQGVALLMFVMSQIDRSNIALAFPSMRADLGLSATAIGFATGVFFWGYLLLQIPVGRLASVWSAKRTLMILGVGWALVSATTALVQTETELVVNRFLLGMTEGGTLPSFVVLMRAWFTRGERARANLVLLGTPIATAIGNPLCGLAVSLTGWRMMTREQPIGCLRPRRRRSSPRWTPKRWRPRFRSVIGSASSGTPSCCCCPSTTCLA
jgi:MFS family permease